MENQPNSQIVTQYLAGKNNEFLDNFWLNIGDTSKIQTINTFKDEAFRENPSLFIVNLMRNPDYFDFTSRWLFNIAPVPFQACLFKELATKTFPMIIAARGASKTFSLAMYSIWRAIFTPGSKVIIAGAAFRQSRQVFENIERIYRESPILRDICGKDNEPKKEADRCSFRIGDSTIIAIPIGDGTRIRGLRATHLIAEEFNSIPTEIFETVIAGFASVSATPVENVKTMARLRALQSLGLDVTTDGAIASNQTIYSGTCGYEFEPFYKYWKKHKDIILSGGDRKKLLEIFNGEIPPGTDYRDYAIMRLPYHLIPEGFMDEKHIGKSKATSVSAIFAAEYGAVFIKDSDGFFKRSLIEQAVCGKVSNPIIAPSCGEVKFTADLVGNRKARYVYGIDPASQVDNFAIVILECHPDHRRIRYCWTANNKKHKAKLKHGLTKEHDFYLYCTRKIRSLMKAFPCERIMLDSQGGGRTIIEALGEPKYLEERENPIYEVIDPEDEKYTDNLIGDHLVELVQFANADWTAEANHNLKYDLENKQLIFPMCDPIVLGEANMLDKQAGRVIIEENGDEGYISESLEDCILEVEEIKNELAIICYERTALSGRERWYAPDIQSSGKKGKIRKDRYSALLMANAGARALARVIPKPEYEAVGGFAQNIVAVNKTREKGSEENKSLYNGPAWLTNQLAHSCVGKGVTRKSR